MSGIDVGALGIAVARAKARMATLEQELNAADSKLGDGDTGVMLARVVDAMAGLAYGTEQDVGAMLSLMARKTASATGSSLGTLFATALLTISRRTKGQTSVPFAEFGDHMAAAVEAMVARGGAKLGDKTVLDILHAVATEIAGLPDAEAVAKAAVQAARSTLAAFRDRPCHIGRARMFADKSIGLDDPGMLAIHELVGAVAQR